MLGVGSSTDLNQLPSRRTPRMPVATDEDVGRPPRSRSMDLERAQLPTQPNTHQDLLRHSILSIIYILGWYLFSVSISVYNKWMFSPDHLDFRFPIFSTSIHQLIQTLLAASILFVVPEFKPQSSFKNFNDYFKRIGPCALASAGDIGMGNLSLRFVTLSFYTMVKSSALGFVLLFGVLFKLEKPTLRLCLIIIFMTLGVLMMVAGETQFQFFGFLLVMGAAACSGLRWSLTQLLLRSGGKNLLAGKDRSAIDEDLPSSSTALLEESLLPLPSPPQSSASSLSSPRALSPPSSPLPSTSSIHSSSHTPSHTPSHSLSNPKHSSTHSTHNNPIYTILSLSPIMSAVLLLFSLFLEGPREIINSNLFRERGFIGGLGLLFFPGILAFCMTLSEFLLLNRTSVLTLAIAGICKEVVTIIVACIFFGDRLTFVNLLGLLVTTACIGAYNIHRYNEMKQQRHKQKHLQDDSTQ